MTLIVKLVISCLLMPLLISGCSGLSVGSNKYREGNAVISDSYPVATFKISRRFEFLDSHEGSYRARSSPSSTSRSRFNNQTFTFIATSGSHIERMAVIQFDTLSISRADWNRDSAEWTGAGVLYEEKTTELGPMETWSAYIKTKDAIDYFEVDLENFEMSECSIVVTARRIPKSMGRYKQMVHYFAPVDCSSYERNHNRNGQLTNAGRHRVSKVLNQAFADILILKD